VRDERLTRYAELLVDSCIGVQAGWEVLVVSTPYARPLLEEIGAVIARRRGYAVFQLSFAGTIGAAEGSWLREAPTEMIAAPSKLQAHLFENCDAVVAVVAPENTRESSAIDAERIGAVQAAYREPLYRLMRHEVPWVGCQYPTPALAQEAGMATEAFADFLYGACLLDWKAEGERMQRYADRFDVADEVRIVGPRTDLRLGIGGRTTRVDAGGTNMPGGEFFCSPVEDSAEGEIVFDEFPAVYAGRELTGVRLSFEGGKVVDASADVNEDFLIETLDRDEGARRLGELGIGCNPGITRYMKNTLFDEKIDGTIHVALGNGFPDLGGTNESTIHWDIVKDLRPRPEPHHRAKPDGVGGQPQGGRIELDGELVQENGRWLV
jgi:aminopeptidase